MKSTKRLAALGLSLALVLTSICGGTPESVQGATKSVTVSTQKQLDKALKSSKYTKITIKSSAKKTLKIKSGKYTKKQLVVKGSKLTVSNAGQFKSVTITDASKYTEAAKNNKITVSDKKLSLVLDKKASVKSIKITKASAAITISGKCTKVTPVTVTGKSAKLTSSVGVKVTASANATITLKKGAEKSTVKIGKNATVKVVNKIKKTIKVM